MQPLSETVIAEMLRSLNGWEFDGSTLKKEFTFDDFIQAMAFMVQAGLNAEKIGHHPEIHNIYNKVSITLSTHDAGDKVTEKDFKLAQAIDEI